MSALPREFRMDADVIVQPVGQETVLLDMRTEHYLGLNPLGSLIWQGLADGHSLADIRRRLVTDYPQVSPKQIADDLDNLIDTLLARKLIYRA